MFVYKEIYINVCIYISGRPSYLEQYWRASSNMLERVVSMIPGGDWVM